MPPGHLQLNSSQVCTQTSALYKQIRSIGVPLHFVNKKIDWQLDTAEAAWELGSIEVALTEVAWQAGQIKEQPGKKVQGDVASGETSCAAAAPSGYA